MRKVILTAMALLTAVTMPASSVKNPIKVKPGGYLTHESKIATIEPEAKTKKSFLMKQTKRVKPSGAQNCNHQELPILQQDPPGDRLLLYHQAWQVYPGSRKTSTKLHHFQRSLYGSLESIHQRLLLSAFWGELGKESMLASTHARQLTWTLMSWCILRQQALKDRREPSSLLPRDGTMLATITSISSIQDLPSD